MVQKNGLTYQDAGVDIDAGNALVEKIKPFARRTRRPGVMDQLGGFGALFDLRDAGFVDPILVSATDGVGTKLKLAIETGIHDTVGIDLVAMCVNDLVVQGAKPLFFLDYFATGALDVDAAARVIEGIGHGCEEAGAALIGGETAELPGLYADGDYDLAGFCVGAAERGQLLPKGSITAGDILIGLPSSGIHSNGYSLVRKICALAGRSWDDPAPFQPGISLGKALLEPTKIYVSAIFGAIELKFDMKALAHITGGGLTENLPRVLPDDLCAEIDLEAVSPPAVFRWLSEAGGVAESEMLRTFNCGTGMVIVVSEDDAPDLLAHYREQDIAAVEIGTLMPRTGDTPVAYRGSLFS